mgnify:CR=1 FL=1
MYNTEDNIELSLIEKEVMRKYVLSLLILPTIVLTILGFSLGFIINVGAIGAANSNAMEKSYHSIIDMSVKAREAVKDAEVAQEKTKEVVDNANKSNVEIELIRQKSKAALEKISSVEAFEIANDKINEIAESVVDNTNIEERITKKFGDRVSILEKSIRKRVDPSSGKVIEVLGGGVWGDWKQITYCPADHFVCGLQQRVEASQGRDDDTALNSVKMICCPF